MKPFKPYFRPSAELAKCHQTTAKRSLLRFRIFSDKLTALMFVLGFLGFCVPLLLAYHAFYENQLSVDFGTVEEDHVISVLTPAFGDALGLDNGSILPFSDEGERYGTCQLNWRPTRKLGTSAPISSGIRRTSCPQFLYFLLQLCSHSFHKPLSRRKPSPISSQLSSSQYIPRIPYQ